MGISTTVTRRKAFAYTKKNHILINHQEKKLCSEVPKTDLEAKIGALEDFTKNASWQASFDYTIQINADETQQSFS